YRPGCRYQADGIAVDDVKSVESDLPSLGRKTPVPFVEDGGQALHENEAGCQRDSDPIGGVEPEKAVQEKIAGPTTVLLTHKKGHQKAAQAEKGEDCVPA